MTDACPRPGRAPRNGGPARWDHLIGHDRYNKRARTLRCARLSVLRTAVRLREHETPSGIPDPEQVMESKDLAMVTRTALANLSTREEKVLCMRFGIGEKSDHTLEEVGQALEVSAERARQIENKAIRKLRGRIGRALRDFAVIKDNPQPQPQPAPPQPESAPGPPCSPWPKFFWIELMDEPDSVAHAVPRSAFIPVPGFFYPTRAFVAVGTTSLCGSLVIRGNAQEPCFRLSTKPQCKECLAQMTPTPEPPAMVAVTVP